MLYQVATASLSPADIATPIRGAVPRAAQRAGAAGRGDRRGYAAARRCMLGDGARIDYDYLVLATGARHSYFGRDDWEPYAPGLKRIDDATAVRRRLLLAFEQAENRGRSRGAATAAHLRHRRRRAHRAWNWPGAIAELARHRHGRRVSQHRSGARRGCCWCSPAPRLLPAFPEIAVGDTRRNRCEQLGVEVLTEQPGGEHRCRRGDGDRPADRRRAPCSGRRAWWPRRPRNGSSADSRPGRPHQGRSRI
ncbi:MAG: hypothetical protein MZV63_19310 [Marinilabiliales bacterium]|nr:hypothetical protein [Marinilabiliales bacterium]